MLDQPRALPFVRELGLSWMNAHVVHAQLLPSIAVFEVVLHWTDNLADPQYAVSSDALRRIEGFTDARGRQLKVLFLESVTAL